MSNSYFQFKQFRIEQSQCGMKVSTDACIQGAWTPLNNTIINILDVGTGTGLLSLMLAQRCEQVLIDAIELDKNAAIQAKENFETSPWSQRLNIIQGDAKIYPFQKKYDLIICNPPFFKNDLLGADHQKNNAKHALRFSLENLMDILSHNLSEDGIVSVLLPLREHAHWEKLLQRKGYGISQQLNIIPSVSKSVNRVISICTGKISEKTIDHFNIRDSEQEYSGKFISLLKEFYLNF